MALNQDEIRANAAQRAVDLAKQLKEATAPTSGEQKPASPLPKRLMPVDGSIGCEALKTPNPQ